MRLIFSFLVILLVGSCGKEDVIKNPFLPDYSFDTQNFIDTRLPEFSKLKYANNFVILDNFGIHGVVLFYAGGDTYSAFEITDPNHQINNCSTLSVNGIIATCNCNDGNSYDILTGNQREGTSGKYTLLRYRVEVHGNIIRVYN